jgi:hypothetical protein
MDEMETTELDKCIALYIETKTPREIAERAGVTPERVIARATYLMTLPERKSRCLMMSMTCTPPGCL